MKIPNSSESIHLDSTTLIHRCQLHFLVATSEGRSASSARPPVNRVMKIQIFWSLGLCYWLMFSRRFEGSLYIHLHGQAVQVLRGYFTL